MFLTRADTISLISNQLLLERVKSLDIHQQSDHTPTF